MKTRNSTSVSVRLSAAFSALALVILALMGVNYWQQAESSRFITELTEVQLEHLQQINELKALTAGTTPRILALNRSADPALRQLFGADVAARRTDINDRVAAIREWATSEDEKAWFGKLDALSLKIRGTLEQLDSARKAGDAAAADAVFSNGFLPLTQIHQTLMNEFITMQRAKLASQVAQAKEVAWRHWAWLAGSLALVLVGVGAYVFRVTRHIVVSMHEAVAVAERVAAGDLTARVQARGSDEFGALMQALSDMGNSLERVVRQVRRGTNEISGAAEQIAQGNLDLSQRTERQAGNLQLTASTMEQLSATVRQSADSAIQANQLSGRASAVAQRGGTAVQQVVQTMGEIEQSSRRIEEIISVIDGISFQTNILALNAAVEAARAGEQGRGFAVVAAEVRQLAQRSANAAKEIKTLIANSSEKVRNGGAQVQTAGSTMEELTQSVQQVTTLIGEISVAAGEQRSGIAGVSQSVVDLDQATQQNAALVEQAAAAAASLRAQATSLNESVSVFKLSQAA